MVSKWRSLILHFFLRYPRQTNFRTGTGLAVGGEKMRRVVSRSVTTAKVLGEQALTLYHHKRFYHHSILNNYHHKRTTLFPTKSKWFLSDDQGNLAFWSSNPLGTCPWRITRLFSLLLQSYSWPAKYLHNIPGVSEGAWFEGAQRWLRRGRHELNGQPTIKTTPKFWWSRE